MSGKWIKVECPHCDGEIKITVEAKPRMVLINHDQEAVPEEDKLFAFPCSGREPQWLLRRSFCERMAGLYPGIDIEEECRKALAWIDTNPTCRKTAKGMPRFLNIWFSKAQDRSKVKPQTRESLMEALND